jgi:hypothetical protein
LHRKEIDYKNQIEEIEQQLRSANNQIQVTLDDCRTQQDLQETMKLEIESIKVCSFLLLGGRNFTPDFRFSTK